MTNAVVLFPSPPIGHLISMVELGKLILTYHPSLSIHILVTTVMRSRTLPRPIRTLKTCCLKARSHHTVPYNAGSTAPYIANVSATVPSIKFHHLPTVTLPSTTAAHHESLTFEVLQLSNPHVHQQLLSISKTHTIRAFVMDVFCVSALSVTSQLNIPSYFFFTSGAGCLAMFFYFPTLHQSLTKSFKDLNTLLEIPGIPPIPSTDMPKPFLDRDDKVYRYFLNICIRLPESAGVLVNTFESLEPRAVRSMSDGLCLPDKRTPPIYCIGPLLAANDRTGGGQSECLTWLDAQPTGSVVFLCFGSLGLFSKQQLGEIADGLESSGHNFLWVVRNPPSNNQSLAISMKTEDQDLESFLPDGFLDRTKERGLVVKSWAPQVAVLNHKAVGGFVTHCGWNSVLEALIAGVPMVAWPLYAEQRLNRVLLVEEIGVALPMKEAEDGFVSATEVEKRVRELMESEEGKSVREKCLAMKNEARIASSDENGSSRVALSKIAEAWKID